MDKYIYTKYTKFFNSFEDLICQYDRCNIGNSNIDLSELKTLEQKILSLLKKVNSLIKRKFDDNVTKKIMDAKDKLEQYLYETRESYVTVFNSIYSFDIDKDDLLVNYQSNIKKTSIEKIMSEKIIEKIIPKHPKDEFRFTRLLKRNFIIHSGETNTGKTYHALEALKLAKNGIYLAPLRLLAFQTFQLLNDNGILCTLSTGEEDIIIPNAEHISSTIEGLSIDTEYDVAVIDEAQMISDKQRGSAWTKAVLGARAKEIHVCCSPNAVKLIVKLIEDCGDTYNIISYKRDTKLIFEKKPFNFPTSVEAGDALIVFTKRMVLGISSILARNGFKVSVVYGNLPPETRKKQMQMFIDHETDVVVSTDAIGMGLNLPIKRIVFMETEKFDGKNLRHIKVDEIKQIAGRSGRKNLYDIGYVNSIKDKNYIKDAIETELKDIKKAYYLPLKKYILGFPIGSLEQRLSLIINAYKGINYILKGNIEQSLFLLSSIDGKYELTDEEKYNLIFIPFDYSKSQLLNQWLSYIRFYVAKKKIAVPKLQSQDTDELEVYYKSLDLYYSFCKIMNIEFDKDEVMNLKYETSERINSILKTKMMKMDNKCKKCGKNLEWNFPYNICQKCYTSSYYYSFDDYDF